MKIKKLSFMLVTLRSTSLTRNLQFLFKRIEKKNCTDVTHERHLKCIQIRILWTHCASGPRTLSESLCTVMHENFFFFSII